MAAGRRRADKGRSAVVMGVGSGDTHGPHPARSSQVSVPAGTRPGFPGHGTVTPETTARPSPEPGEPSPVAAQAAARPRKREEASRQAVLGPHEVTGWGQVARAPVSCPGELVVRGVRGGRCGPPYSWGLWSDCTPRMGLT